MNKKITICKAVKEPFIGSEANECHYIHPVNRSDFTMIYQLKYEQDSEYENDEFIHESASPNTPVTDNHDHVISSWSRVQVCQSPTFELYYKNRQLKVTLDTGATVSHIT